MDDRISVIKRQVEKGYTIDEEARDIYRIAILVISIIVATAAINFDVSNIVQTMVYDIGVAFSTDESSLLVRSFEYFGGISIFVSFILLLIIATMFSLMFVVVVGLFFVPPYYAVRAQASAPISSDENTLELIAYDVTVFLNTNPFRRIIPKRYRKELPSDKKNRIISDVEQEFEEYDGLNDVIDYNKDVLFNKTENLSRAKNSTQRFFISIVIFSAIVVVMIYI